MCGYECVSGVCMCGYVSVCVSGVHACVGMSV